MSRRKKRPLIDMGDGTTRRGNPGTDRYIADRVVISIGCTGRGSHKQVSIGSWDVRGDLEVTETTKLIGDFDTWQEDYAFIKDRGAPERYLVEGPKPHMTQPIKCGYCERDMPVTEGNLFRRLRVLKAYGVSFLDLSTLD